MKMTYGFIAVALGLLCVMFVACSDKATTDKTGTKSSTNAKTAVTEVKK